MKKKIEVKAKLLGEKVNYSSDDTPRCALSLENGMPQRKSRFWVLLQPNKKKTEDKRDLLSHKILLTLVCMHLPRSSRACPEERERIESTRKFD